MNNIASTFAPSQHRSYTRGLTDDEMRKIAPSIFAEAAHESRSARYGYVPTFDVVQGMRNEGFLPVKVVQCKSRVEGKADFTKHMMRFRRHDQLAAAEAREVVIVNSHDGSSAYEMMAGVFRMICANGLIIGSKDNCIKVRHNSSAVQNVIEGAYEIVHDFDRVGEAIEGMKALQLQPRDQIAFGRAALALRFDDPDNCGFTPEQIVMPRRNEDKILDLWTTYNVAQENLIKGGLKGERFNANGKRVKATTRSINGIGQDVALNRALFTLAQSMKDMLS